MHRILAVKDALLRRNISVDPCCLSRDQNLEMIEYLFLQCWFAKRLWRASHLGFNFDVETPVSFGVWFEGWILTAPFKELIWDSVFTLWFILCARNDALFRSANWESVNVFDNALTCFSGLRNLYRSVKKCGFQDVLQPGAGHGSVIRSPNLQFVFKGGEMDVLGFKFFLTYGSWHASSGCVG